MIPANSKYEIVVVPTHVGVNPRRIRWRAADLESAVVDDLAALRMPSQETVDWFRGPLAAAFSETDEYERRQAAQLKRRRSEIAGMQDRLLNVYLTGTVEEDSYKAKADELGGKSRTLEEALDRLGDGDSGRAATALAAFDFSQQAADLYRGSSSAAKREVLDSVCLNRTLSDASLLTTKRKPFDVLAKRPVLKDTGRYRT